MLPRLVKQLQQIARLPPAHPAPPRTHTAQIGTARPATSTPNARTPIQHQCKQRRHATCPTTQYSGSTPGTIRSTITTGTKLSTAGRGRGTNRGADAAPAAALTAGHPAATAADRRESPPPPHQ